MTVTLEYCTSFGDGDSGDFVEWEAELTEKQAAAYLQAKKLRRPLESVRELKNIPDREYDAIEEESIRNLIENEDWSALELMGLLPVSADEINGLVAARDPHTLEFFGLTDLDEKKLAKWDARKLKKLPEVREFHEDFEPENPYDTIYSLHIDFAEHPDVEELEEDEARETLTELLSAVPPDIRKARDYVKRCSELYMGEDLRALSVEVAGELGLGKDVAAKLRRKR